MVDQMLQDKSPTYVHEQLGRSRRCSKATNWRYIHLIETANRQVVDDIVQDPVEISPEELNDPDYINRIGNAIAD
ncbi:MAG: hypothetical protein ACLU4J_19030 [Butyricimonas paravirosa]